MEVEVFADVKRIGPGMWFLIHRQAKRAVTDELKRAFEININDICDGFRCNTCRPHFRKFIDTHPFSSYWNIYDSKGRDIGFFKWTWELHNEANKHLGKYQPSLEESYNYFSSDDSGVCFDCGGQEGKQEEHTNRKENPIIMRVVKKPPHSHPSNVNEKKSTQNSGFRLISR